MSRATSLPAVAVSAEHGRFRQARAGLADGQESRPEVMPPLRNAMGFVDGEKTHLLVFEQGQEVGIGQALRRREDDLRGAGSERGLGGADLLGGHAAVQLERGDAALAQLVALVLHQGDERRDDDRDAWQQQGRQLVAKRFAGTRGHEGQRRSARQHVGDDLLLAGAQMLQPEGPTQHARHARERGRISLDAWHVEGGGCGNGEGPPAPPKATTVPGLLALEWAHGLLHRRAETFSRSPCPTPRP